MISRRSLARFAFLPVSIGAAMCATGGDRAAKIARRPDARALASPISVDRRLVPLARILAIARLADGGLIGDPSWLFTAGEDFLDGKTAYMDLIETKPPAAILTYLPAIFVACLAGTPPSSWSRCSVS
jgi:hypothetical protein